MKYLLRGLRADKLCSACLCSAFRLLQFQNPKWKSGEDPLWAFVHAGVWSSIEQSVGVICACLPCLRIFIASRQWDTGSVVETAGTAAYATRTNKSDNSRVQRLEGASSSEVELTASLSMAPKNSAHTAEVEDNASLEQMRTAYDDRAGIWRTQEVRQESMTLQAGNR